ncbi:hypothetical protein [Bilophila wadsworthia]|jgi:hypothetical protein|uniref:hypothetical protein n=1 Tax=Bilophila wadsworthia TaxID=35833 RepID=UPI00049564E8|nr:hypothetical protein [Bilophila wadsworthia]MDU4376270.1 hypothetical protein [Bilophila wadsworthia]
MGKFKRIPVKDINAMRKILDDLPDRNLGKTREEAAELLNANILKAIEKGYTVRELADIMAQGNVVIPAPVIRAKVLPQKAVPRKRELKPRPEAVKPVAVPPVMSQTQEDIPEYYTPDKPDTEL